MHDHTERPSGEAPPPMPGFVELRLRGRPSDVDALIDVLSTCVPITVTPRKHWRDADGKTVRRYVTAKPLYPGQTEQEGGSLAPQADGDLRDLLVEIARRNTGGFELLAAAVKLADEMPYDEGRAKARDRFVEDLMAGGVS